MGRDFPKATDEAAVLGAAEQQEQQRPDERRWAAPIVAAQWDAARKERIPSAWARGPVVAVGPAVARMALRPQAQLELAQVAMAALRVSVQLALALQPQGPEAQGRLPAERAFAAPQLLEEVEQQEQQPLERRERLAF
jgi:hypothetical protein